METINASINSNRNNNASINLNAAFTCKENAARRVLALYGTGRRGMGTMARREAQRSLLAAQDGYLAALGAMRSGATAH